MRRADDESSKGVQGSLGLSYLSGVAEHDATPGPGVFKRPWELLLNAPVAKAPEPKHAVSCAAE